MTESLLGAKNAIPPSLRCSRRAIKFIMIHIIPSPRRVFSTLIGQRSDIKSKKSSRESLNAPRLPDSFFFRPITIADSETENNTAKKRYLN
jgi:hypothetical protein